MPEFRSKAPVRTCTKTYANHRSYKPYLVKDFSNRCGFCDAIDTWYGGFRIFHVDHFAPASKFPALKTTYSNLIYSCPSCNGAKSDSWPSDDPTKNVVDNKGFLDPVINDFNTHFERDEFGNISGKTLIGKDMAISLKLGLDRHSTLWVLSKLDEIIKGLEQILLKLPAGNDIREKFEELHYILLKIFKGYLDKLNVLNS